MKLQRVVFQCPLCQSEYQVSCAKPTHVTPSFGANKCPNCEASYRVRFSLERGKHGFVRFDPELIGATAKTKDLLKLKHPHLIQPKQTAEVEAHDATTTETNP